MKYLADFSIPCFVNSFQPLNIQAWQDSPRASDLDSVIKNLYLNVCTSLVIISMSNSIDNGFPYSLKRILRDVYTFKTYDLPRKMSVLNEECLHIIINN